MPEVHPVNPGQFLGHQARYPRTVDFAVNDASVWKEHWLEAETLVLSVACAANFMHDLWPLFIYETRTPDLQIILCPLGCRLEQVVSWETL